MDMSWLNVSLLIWSFIIEQWLIHNVSIQLIDYNQRFLSLFTIYLICNIAINKYLQNFLIAFACSFNIKLILIHINLSLLLLVSLLNISLSNHCSLIVIDENYFIIYTYLGGIINIRIISPNNIHSVTGRLIGGVIVNHFIGQIARMSRITKKK